MVERVQPKIASKVSSKIESAGVFVQIKHRIKYSPDGYTVLELEPGKYEASKLHPVVLELHKNGVI